MMLFDIAESPCPLTQGSICMPEISLAGEAETEMARALTKRIP
jgi:hypothetical protein